MKIDYSIVIPAYNEKARIGATLVEVVQCVEENNWNAEIIVVDDGSTDTTAAIVNTAAAQYPIVRLLPNGTNRGKGYSVRHGMLHASGGIVMFTDADLSSPMQEAHRLFNAIREGADVAIGSRWLERKRQTIHQPLYRQFFGRCFNLVTRMIMRLPFADTQCGFRRLHPPGRANRLPTPAHASNAGDSTRKFSSSLSSVVIKCARCR